MARENSKENLRTEYPSVETLDFFPSPVMSSPHFQTIVPTLFNIKGEEPPSASFFILLEDGDVLCCKMSTPSSWNSKQKTIVIVHGLGGTDGSSYMVRMSRKFYRAGYRTIRLNLRGSGPAAHLARRPYHGGTSQDLFHTLRVLKQQSPDSPIVLIGFSLGGNIALKLIGELGEEINSLIEYTIAICSPLDLTRTIQLLLTQSNRFYHHYYLNGLQKMATRWLKGQQVNSMIDFDNAVTAPQWGFQDAFDYYRQCSSISFLPFIRHPCHLIFAADDPFVDYQVVLKSSRTSSVKIWLSQYGGHMGFWAWTGKEHGYFWLDRLLLEWVNKL